MKRSEKPHATGRTPIYDFDEWSRNHYGDTFERKQRAKKKFDENVFKTTNDKLDNEKYVLIFLLAIITALMMFFYSNEYMYDRVLEKKNDKKRTN